MAISMEEGFLSRDGEKAQESTYQKIYLTFGETNEQTAYDYVVANGDLTYNGIPLYSVAREQISNDIYRFTFGYKLDFRQVSPGETKLTFTTRGGTAHITNSLGYVSYARPGKTPTDYKGAIGVEFDNNGNKARIRGLDVVVGVSEFTLTTQFYSSSVTDFMRDCWERLTGRVNNSPYGGRPAGSLLFKGVQGGTAGQDRDEYAFEFAYSPNQTGLTVGEITGIDKLGWQYLDIIYEQNGRDADSFQILRPKQVTVHDIFPYDNFYDLFIP